MEADAPIPVQPLDFYAVLGADPGTPAAGLRLAFRRAVMRHHPDLAGSQPLATRRTSLLNRAWRELRDPTRRQAYDRALADGSALLVDWPVIPGEAPPVRRARRARAGSAPSPWHQPAWRTMAGFRVPAAVYLAGPDAQRRWIVAHHLDGEDWRSHRERYWLRFAAHHYRDRGRTDDWLGALERLVGVDPAFETLATADLGAAYRAADQPLRGVGFLAEIAERYPAGSRARAFVEREQRALLGSFRDRRVRRGPLAERAEMADMLLNLLEALGLTPSWTDLRASWAAHRMAGNEARAGQVLARLLAAPVDHGDGWFALLQVLTEAGHLDRASALLAEIARGDHPEALDRRHLRGEPASRLAAARRRLSRARAAAS